MRLAGSEAISRNACLTHAVTAFLPDPGSPGHLRQAFSASVSAIPLTGLPNGYKIYLGYILMPCLSTAGQIYLLRKHLNNCWNMRAVRSNLSGEWK